MLVFLFYHFLVCNFMLLHPVNGLCAMTLLTLCFKLCKRLACVNETYCRVSNEIDSLKQTCVLFWFYDMFMKNCFISTCKILLGKV